MMEIGARVKLRPDLAKRMGAGYKEKHKRVNWRKRVGVVVSTGHAKHAITAAGIAVRWDDRRSTDYWPEKALVVINAGG